MTEAQDQRDRPPDRAPADAPTDPVQEASEESFPASDPPSWEPLHPGAPPDTSRAAVPPSESDA